VSEPCACLACTHSAAAAAAGGCAELGHWTPEVSPSLQWQEGGIWSAELALPPGEYSFKCMLRRADGSYVWEAGENRHLLVSRRQQQARPGHRQTPVQRYRLASSLNC
jgi:hypothetical protein